MAFANLTKRTQIATVNSIASNRGLIVSMYRSSGNYKIYDTVTKKIKNTKTNDLEKVAQILIQIKK